MLLLAVPAVLFTLTGCAVGASESSALTNTFPDATEPRVPTSAEMVGEWTVVSVSEPDKEFYSVAFEPGDYDADMAEEFEMKFDPATTGDVESVVWWNTTQECNDASGSAGITADGKFLEFISASTLMGCLDLDGESSNAYLASLPIDDLSFVAIDSAEDLWFATDDGQRYQLTQE